MGRVPDDPQSPGLGRPASDGLDLEDVLSMVLRAGVMISMALVIGGMLLTFVHHPDYLWSPAGLNLLIAPISLPRTFGSVAEGAVAAKGQSVVMVGLLLLVATPIIRVGLSLLVFLRRRDRAFTGIVLAVLGLLLASFLLGNAGA